MKTEVTTELETLKNENNAMEQLLNERKRQLQLIRQLNNHHPTKVAIAARVASIFGIRYDDLFGKRRPEHIVWPRHIAMSLIYEICDESLSDVGTFFGGRDHGTVMHAIRNVKNRCEVDNRAKATVESIRALLKEKTPLTSEAA